MTVAELIEKPNELLEERKVKEFFNFCKKVKNHNEWVLGYCAFLDSSPDYYVPKYLGDYHPAEDEDEE